MHGESDRSTQIEGNTYTPRFLWKTKMPFNENMGLHFHVMEANVVKGNDVMGRAFIDKEQIQEMLEEGGSFLLSVGENIGVIKVRIFENRAWGAKLPSLNFLRHIASRYTSIQYTISFSQLFASYCIDTHRIHHIQI